MLDLLKTDLMDLDERTELQEMARHFDSLPSTDSRLVTFGPLMYHMQCFDARDKAFSLLGLLTGSHRARIPVNYNLSTSEIFIQATYADIEASGSLDILCLVSKPCETGTPQLPSWCVDFAFPRNDRSGRFSPKAVHGFGEWIARDVPRWHRSQSSTQDRPAFYPDDRSLSFRGLRLDKVRAALPVAEWLKYYSPRFAQEPCEQVRASLAMATRDDELPLGWCTSESADAILESLRTVPLKDGQVPYECAANILRDRNPEIGRFFVDQNLELDRYNRYVVASNGDGVLFLTQYGHLGFGANTISSGDAIVLPHASRFALALREAPSNPKRWTFLSLVYVPSVADLKLNDPETDDSQLVAEEFRII